MTRAALLQAFDMAERHVAEGERHIRRQQEIIDRLKHIGRGAGQTAVIAEDLLFSMQRAHLSHRDQLRAELAHLNGGEDLSGAESLDWSAVGASPDNADGKDAR